VVDVTNHSNLENRF